MEIINLPSFILIKKLHNKYADLCNQDEGLNNLFLNVTEYSKLFYVRTTDSIKSSKRNGEEFEASFGRAALPLGQRLINLLVNIKFRIKVARFKRQVKER